MTRRYCRYNGGQSGTRQSGSGEVRGELAARRQPGAEVPAVDHREPEAARRHAVLIRRAILMKGDLHARHARDPQRLLDQLARRMAKRMAVRTEQDDAVAVAPRLVGEVPALLVIEPHHRRDPGVAAIEVWPLVGEAQMRLDDA